MKYNITDRILTSNTNINYFYWDNFDYAKEQIVYDIKSTYSQLESIGIVGVARGGLPLLTAVAHDLEIRDVSVIQVKMTNSDNKFDYGKANMIDGYLCGNYSTYIIIEDVIYKGHSSSLVANYLEEQDKTVLGIYSLVIDEAFLEKKNTLRYDVRGVYRLRKDQWVVFPWR